MFCGTADTLKVCVTGIAGGILPFPAWLAVIEQTPAAMSVTLTPDIVQIKGLLEVNVTMSPEEAVADSMIGGVPRLALASGPNVML